MKDHEIMQQFDHHLELISKIAKVVDKFLDLDRVTNERISLVNLRIDSLARKLERIEERCK